MSPRDRHSSPDPNTPPADGLALAEVLPPRRRSRHVIETVLLASTAALLAAVAWPIAISGLRSDATPPAADETPIVIETPVAPLPAAEPATIQIALLLDTSSSMDGLIDQARSQLWKVVNAIDTVTFHGERPRLEVALYEYGNDRLDPSGGWIRQVAPFTVELDRVSEALFSLQTMGGSEHAGQVIARSLDELAWRTGEHDLKVIYIAGNEEFAQGPVDWRSAIEAAKTRGIVVNTINCASPAHEDAGWRAAATLAGGRFMTIDHNAVEQYIAAPQDAKIAELGGLINDTYVGFGAEGKRGLENQVEQDNNSGRYGMGSVVQRSVSKSSHYYRNPTWDLVDAVDGKTVTLADVDRSDLPPEARDLDDAGLDRWLSEKRTKRAELQAALAKLAAEREAFIAAERTKQAGEDADRLDTAMVDSIVSQAQAAGFTIQRTDS